MGQDDTCTVTFEKKPRLIFSFYLYLRLTSPNDIFMGSVVAQSQSA